MSKSAQNSTPSPVAVLNALPEMCFSIAVDGTVLFANTAASDQLESPRELISGKRITEFLEKQHQAPVLAAVERCVKHGASEKLECDFISARGARIATVVHLAPTLDLSPAGSMLLSARSVSGDKDKDLNLLRFANVAHYTVNPLEITDTMGRIVYVNPAFEVASGYAKEELIGKNPNVFGSGKHGKSFWKNMWHTITSGRVWVGEVENKRRNGEPYLTQILISPIVDSLGVIVGYFGIHRDITQQRHLEQQLVHAQKMESIGMLAAGLAHEVGNPLTSISSIVQVIQRTTKDEFAKEKLGLIKSQINRISRIIRELVDFARQTTTETSTTDINRAISEAVDIVRAGTKARTISFKMNLDEHLPHLPLVPDKIQQVFINILINAVDAMHDRPAERKEAGIVVTSSCTQDEVLVKIQDHGVGIPTHAVQNIFDPFFTTKAVGEGTGLGLWVSYTIVKSFDGDIRVESAEGDGTSFTIKFPITL